MSASWNWVPVHEIARRMGLSDEVVREAVQRAVQLGWLEVTEDWPPSVRLSSDLLDEL